ncbi:hypothetical protein HYC85_014888 [Camellia sinensis]|uniref:Cation/H+ exchanger transmembrane domain-containing protein n=1 Tax=Camellia sinensis TaxID=4442 RepID=A0A7J7H9J8_CAMSI|nr:hypothetical protein HYC85_014888 [Camellia sinensis]
MQQQRSTEPSPEYKTNGGKTRIAIQTAKENFFRALELCRPSQGVNLLQLSGILTVFFCGILMHAFATMSFIAETFIFLYVGMDALDIEKWRTSKLSFGTSLGIYASTIFLICLGRAAFVFPLSAFSNYMNRNADRSSSITFKHQIVIWWAGLMRGAVSIALAFKQFTYSGVTWDPLNATMVTTTIIVVLFSTINLTIRDSIHDSIHNFCKIDTNL